MKVSSTTVSLALAAYAAARANINVARDSNGLQNVVTWDQYSLLINGTRVRIYSGEAHPFR
jgi:hypothetical protein